MIINFSNYLPKQAIFGYFRPFLTKIRAYMILFNPTCLFEIEISSSYTLIRSYTTIRYCRVCKVELYGLTFPKVNRLQQKIEVSLDLALCNGIKVCELPFYSLFCNPCLLSEAKRYLIYRASDHRWCGGSDGPRWFSCSNGLTSQFFFAFETFTV